MDSEELLKQCAGSTFTYPLQKAKMDELVGQDNVYPFLLTDGDEIFAYGDILKDGDKEVRLCRLLSSKASRGKGYGKELVIQLSQKAKQLFPELPLRLFVIVDNDPAYYCYLKSGFQETGARFQIPDLEPPTWVLQMEYHGS